MKRSVFENFKTRLYRKSILSFAAGIFFMGIAVFQISKIILEYKNGTEVYENIQDSVIEKTEPKEAEADDGEQGIQIDFDALKAINEDIIGWIYFENNDISYPLLQGEDNSEYLYTMADGTKNQAGSIFLDAGNSSDFMDAHTIIYGHNMKNLSMFGLLKNYKTEETYYEENPCFMIYTPQASYRYEIFAYYDVKENDSIYRIGFIPNDTFAEFIQQMKKKSYRDTGIEVKKEDKVVTLSTCSEQGKRFVVNAKRVE